MQARGTPSEHQTAKLEEIIIGYHFISMSSTTEILRGYNFEAHILTHSPSTRNNSGHLKKTHTHTHTHTNHKNKRKIQGRALKMKGGRRYMG
jgi:hypothetical protein